MAYVEDRGPPSAASIAIGTAIVSGLCGYFVGQARSIGLFGGSSATRGLQGDSDDASDASSVSVDDANLQDLAELDKLSDNSNEECKLVLVVRTDLGMGKGTSRLILAAPTYADPSQGKIAAQCSHATLACYKALRRQDPSHPILKQWERLGQAKIAVKVDSEEEMLLLQAQAVSLGLCAQVIRDAGRTQIASGSATVLGVGPAPKSRVDEVTGHLKLL